MPDTVTEPRSDLERCLDLCQACHKACLETMLYCLGRGGAHADADHIRLLADCAEICQTTANFMLRESPLHGAVCGACAEICGQCATACETFAGEGRLDHCAEICRQCAASCAAMSGL